MTIVIGILAAIGVVVVAFVVGLFIVGRVTDFDEYKRMLEETARLDH